MDTAPPDPPTPPTDPAATPPEPEPKKRPTINLNFEPPAEEELPLGWRPGQPLGAPAGPPAPMPGATVAGMTGEQMAAIREADDAAKKIRRVASIASTDGGITGFFAFCCILCTCFGWVNLVLGLAFTYVAWVSFKNAAAIRRFDVAAPKRLAINQIVLASIVSLYFLYMIWITLHAPAESLDIPGIGDLSQLGIDSKQMSGYTVAMYVFLIGASVVVQGLTAAYYYSRTRIIEEYLRVTPGWVIDFRKTIPR